MTNRDRLAGRAAALLLAVLLSTGLAPPARAEQPDDRRDDDTPDATLEGRAAQVVIPMLEERAKLVTELLLDSARAYRKVAIERGSVQQELSANLERLDREAVRPRELSRDRIDQLAQDVQRTRARLFELYDEMDRRLDDMRRLVTERDQITRRLADLRGRPPAAQEPLTGSWEITWMPSGVTGTFFLDQSGTLVTGQYKLGALGTGSLQGTFVGGKLFLQRIDAQRGRDCEIEGVLEAEGARLRGTWQNYEMVQGGIPRGQWVARRAR